MAKVPGINSMIHNVYDSETEMAEAMGWSRQRLNRITNGKKTPDLFEVCDMAQAMNTSFINVARLFLGEKSTFVDGKKPDPYDLY